MLRVVYSEDEGPQSKNICVVCGAGFAIITKVDAGKWGCR